MESLANEKTGVAPAAITSERPERSAAAPVAPVKVSGTTTLLARCLRVGGASEPTAELRLARGGRLLHVKVSEEIAKHLGRHLYDEVLLRGTATWRSGTWEIESFQVESVVEFDRSAPSTAFQELATAAGDALEDVDAWESVRQEHEAE